MENYILIQRVRLHDAFEVTWSVDPDALLIVVPKLILQPLVENSITHGLYEYQTGGRIAIRVVREEGLLVIEVTDNGVGIPADELEALRRTLNRPAGDADRAGTGSGLALRNIFLRLQMYGGGETSLTIDSTPMQGTRVTIRLDIRPAEGPPSVRG